MPWTVARQAPLSIGFSRQEQWSVLLFPSVGDLSSPGIEPRSPALQADSLLRFSGHLSHSKPRGSKPWTSLHFPSSIPAIWPALRILFPTVTTFHSHLISGWSTIFFAITQMTPLISNFIHSHQPVQPPPLTFMLFVPNGASSIFPISASLRFSHSWLLSPFQLTFCGQTLQLCSHAQPRTSRLLWPTLEPAQSTTTPAHFQSPFSVLDFRLQWRLSQAFVDLTLALCNLGSNP